MENLRDPKPATDEVFVLAEGPVWDPERGRLLWVDIVGGDVVEGLLEHGGIEVVGRRHFDEMVGSVAVAADGTLLLALQERLVVVCVDGTREDVARIVPTGERRRCNDGSTDPAGRFVVGTLCLEGESRGEVLVRLEDDRSLTRIDDDLRLSNGLAWSVDGSRMYSVDTLRRQVFVRDYDPLTARSGPRRPHTRLEDGFPDGVAVDAEDHLWVAVWGSGEVRRFNPDGDVVSRLAVPAPHTSSVAFAGDDLRTLVVTSATDELSDAQLRSYPDSGRLFTTRVDVPGAPVPYWSGLTERPPCS